MDNSSLHYKGFMIEPLVYLIPLTPSQRSRNSLHRRYEAAVRLTDLALSVSSICKLPPQTGFDCVGDARRAAEVYARRIIDLPRAGETAA